MTTREIAIHEAHHAAALCLAGMVPECARIDWPTALAEGLTIIDWGDGINRSNARDVLIAILLGGMTGGSHGWDEWPLDPDAVPEGSRNDAMQCNTLAEHLGITERGEWLRVVWQANQLHKTTEFRRLAVAIADEFVSGVEVLHADGLRRLMEAAGVTPPKVTPTD